MVLEKTCESPSDNKEIKPVNLQGNQPWTLIGRTDAEIEILVFWPSDVNNWLIGKVPDSGKEWHQSQKRGSLNEMAGWQTNVMDMNLGKLREMMRDRKAWHVVVHGVAESEMTGWLNNNNKIPSVLIFKYFCCKN